MKLMKMWSCVRFARNASLRQTKKKRLGERLETRRCLSAIALIEHPDDVPPELSEDQIVVRSFFADIDEDGDIDEIHIEGLRVFLRETLDDGQVSESQLLFSSTAPLVDVTDVDGDGDADMLAKRGSVFYIHENLGGGSFTFGRVFAAVNLPSEGIILGEDLDGDGDTDYLADGRWFKNDGMFRFEEHATSISRYETDRYLDVDLDGDVDIVGRLPEFQDAVVVLMEDGVYQRYELDFAGEIVGAIDMEGDGLRDLVVRAEGEVYVMLNNGHEDIRLAWALQGTNIDGSEGYEFTAEDFDGDGDEDLIGVPQTGGFAPTSDPVMIYLNERPGTFEEIRISSGAIGFFNAAWVRIEDRDQDGDLDVSVCYRQGFIFSTTTCFWHEQRVVGDSNNDGIFDSGDLVAVFAAGEYEDDATSNSTFDTGDWNQDGEFNSSDLVVAFQAGRYVGK